MHLGRTYPDYRCLFVDERYLEEMYGDIEESHIGQMLKQELYSQTLFHRFQNLKQNLSSMQEYTNEFYKLSMHIEHQ